MTRTANPMLPTFWRERIRRQEESGLTIEQYRGQEGLTRSSFHAWKRHLSLADAVKPPVSSPARPPPSIVYEGQPRVAETIAA